MIDKAAETVPIYKQLKNMILEDIESGKLKYGDKLPSERELAEKANISRMTARNALSILEREGFVERRVGAGTFIAKKIEMDLITFNSFSKELLIRGLEPTTKLLHMRKDHAKLTLANSLKIEVGEEIIVINRLRLGDHIPIAIEESYIPYKYCKGIEDYMSDNVSLYEILEKHYGITLIRADQYMQVVLSDEEESKLLKIKNEAPCILLEAVAFDTKGQAVEFSRSTTRSDIVKYYSELHLKNPNRD